MASQYQGESDDVLPLDALKSLVPKCDEDDLDIPECARYTIDSCVLEATARLLFESANAAVRANRKVISGEDMVCAMERLEEKDTVPDAAKKEMNARVEADKRAARVRRAQSREQTLREERKAREERKRKAREAVERKAREEAADAAERKEDGEEAADAAEREEAPGTPEDEGSSTTGGYCY